MHWRTVRCWYESYVEMTTWLKTKLRQLRQALKRWKYDDGSLLAASLAYYATFSFFPLLLILISVLGFALRFSSGAQDAQRELLNLLGQNTSTLLAGHVETALAEIRTNAVVTGPLGLVTLLLTAIVIFTQLEAALDRIWNVDKTRSKGIILAIRNALFYRLRAFLMLIGMGLLVLAAFVGGIVVSAVRPLAIDLAGGGLVWNLIQILTGVGLNWLLLTVIYKVLPKGRVRWSEASGGGVVAAVLWEAGRQLLALLLVGKKYSVYGVVGSLMALMLWIFFASNVFLLGAEYVRVISGDRGERASPSRR